MIAERWASLPRPIRSFVIDAVEGSITALLLLNVVLPHNVTEATAQGVVVLGAVASPIIAAGRRNILPAILEWWTSVRASAA